MSDAGPCIGDRSPVLVILDPRSLSIDVSLYFVLLGITIA